MYVLEFYSYLSPPSPLIPQRRPNRILLQLIFFYFILCLLRFSKKQVANLVTTRPSSVTPIPSLFLYVRVCLTIWIVIVRKLNLCESICESWRIEEKYLKWFLMNIFDRTKEIKEKDAIKDREVSPKWLPY